MKVLQKKILAGVGVVALTAGSLIACAQKPLSESEECIKKATPQQIEAAGSVVNFCSGVQVDAPPTPEQKKELAKLTAEVEAEAAAALADESQTEAATGHPNWKMIDAPGWATGQYSAPVENKGRCMTEECQAEQRLQEIINDCKAGVFGNLSGEAAVDHCDKHYPIWRR